MIKPHYLAGLVLAFFIVLNPVTVNAQDTIYQEEIQRQFEEQFQYQFMLQWQEQYMEQLQAQLNPVEEQLYSPSDYERDVAARVIYAEAGNQGYYGMYLVAETIVNRVLSPLYPNTIDRVCLQPNQYTTINRGVTDGCYQAIDEACKHLEHNITHFCSGGVWPAYGYRVLEYGAHKFTSHL